MTKKDAIAFFKKHPEAWGVSCDVKKFSRWISEPSSADGTCAKGEIEIKGRIRYVWEHKI